jgi:hypothetical protein
MKEEALRLALEALEAHADIGIKADKAITAIKAALEAKDEPEQMAKLGWQVIDCPICGGGARAFPKQEAKDEPVAWRTFDGEGGYDYRTYENNEDYANDWDKRNPNHKGWVEPLYTTPPQRTWVGLTDEEILIMSRYDLEYAALIGEVQRKLKEKNT